MQPLATLPLVLTVFSLLAACIMPTNAGLILNGSFEEGPTSFPPNFFSSGYITLSDGDTSIPGWIVKTPIPGRDINYKGTYWQNSDGTRSVDLNGENGPGGIAQSFTTVPGNTYQLTFDIAGNPTVVINPVKTMEVVAGGNSKQFTVDNTGRTLTNMGWETHSWEFTATNTSTELWFRMVFPDFGAEGIGLDNMYVTEMVATPEPNAFTLLAVSGLGFFACRWRRRPTRHLLR